MDQHLRPRACPDRPAVALGRTGRLRPLRLAAALGGLVAVLGGLRAAPESQRLELDTDRSSLEVQVQATLTTFTALVPHFVTDIRVDAAHQLVESAEVSFDFADVKTGIALRDRHMREWEQVARFPKVRFHLDSLETASGNRTVVHGGLVLHGIEHAISFPVSLLVAGPVYSIDGEVEIDTRDFGLPPIRRFWVVTVATRLVVRFHLQGRLAGPV